MRSGLNGVSRHYTERGEGAPLVLLHGNGSMIEDFASSGLIDLAARRHRVIVFDRPGYGHSTRPRHTIWTPAAQAKLIHAAVQRIGVSRAVVLGHSWATSVAMALALEHAEAVSGFVLASGYYYPSAGRCGNHLRSSDTPLGRHRATPSPLSRAGWLGLSSCARSSARHQWLVFLRL